MKSTRQADALHFGRAWHDLLDLLRPTRRGSTQPRQRNDDTLTDATMLVMQASGIHTRLKACAATAALPDRVAQLAQQAGASVRTVNLSADAWWRDDVGALLAFCGTDQRPVALLPAGRRGYRMVDPAGGTSRRLDRSAVAGLAPVVYHFFRQFPPGPVTPARLMRFALVGCSADLLRLAAAATVGALLSLALPCAIGILVEQIIPNALHDSLTQMLLILLAIVIASGAVTGLRALAWLRIDARMGYAVQVAMLQRLLDLPAAFFRTQAALDMAQRVWGVNELVRVLGAAAQHAWFNAMVGLCSLGYLFFIHPTLAWLSTGLAACIFCMTLVAGLRRLRIERRAAALNGRIASRALQLLTGIATLRAGGAEKRAFALWEGDFGHHRSQQQRRGHIDAGLAVLHDCALIVATLVLFSAVARLAPGLGTGSFLAFHAAFLQFLLAVLGLAGALTDGFHLLPLLERAKPILQAAPEVDTRQAAPAALAGDIDISHLSFRYGADSPPVLNDLCVHIAAGEFVAIVGASSSGKSTLLRLLLGFEQPDRGAIYFDGVDLRGLDAMSVRRQMGVVLQHGRLMPGDIYSNIVGTSGMSLDDAWEAARLAGLADDIRAMPMGMHTVIVDAASTLSGGQRQRLLVARAIVARPRILLFDEATSALDNLTQAMVARSIAKLQVTRIVIAHRMSTVVGADRVLVLDGGHIVEQGTFAELLARGGKLAELARCQMI